MKAHSISLKTIALLLVTALIAAGCQPALAEEVTVEDTAPDIEYGGPADADFVTANSGKDLAMLYVAPTVPRDAVLDPSTATSSPLTLRIASGADTRLGVDVSAISETAEREGWPWYAWAGVVIGTAAVAGLAAWAIVEATRESSHDHDSSQHYTFYGDDGSTINVHFGDESSSSTRTGD